MFLIVSKNMKNGTSLTTREKILHTLLRQRQCTINELAKAVEINPISVRHHITRLEADGLVVSEEQRHGVGRPRRVYLLSEAGLEHFPTRYLRLTIRLLQQLKDHLPTEMVGQLFADMASDMADDYAQFMPIINLSMEQRLELVKDILMNEGFNVEWEQKDDRYHIREISCPYLHIGQTHPEVCQVDQTLISSLLNVPVEKIHCILDGDSHCTYVLPKEEQKLSQAETIT
jgi:DeoR family transcriptional regulator, suf operon transcriptional repressor